MPLYWCPKCKKRRPTWDIRLAKCDECGYSITESITNPSIYQQQKINKHTLGSIYYDIKNWKFYPHIDHEKIIKDVATSGSCVDGSCIVASFDNNQGYKETDSTKVTKWVLLVLYDNIHDSHIYPLDPSKYSNVKWFCQNCGTSYIGECPLNCKNCGKHMWIKES